MTRPIHVGLVIKNVVQPGTDWILRDPAAWFETGSDDAPVRKRWPITKFVTHWTGGRCHEGPDAARRVVAAMKARLREDGTPMSVSIPFVATWDGLVFQTCDLGAMTIHAGRVLNDDSAAAEMCWPGYVSQARKLGIANPIEIPRIVNGHRVLVMKPSEAMVAAVVRLAETLASLPPSSGVAIPRIVAPQRRLSPKEARAARGLLAHASSPGSDKLDDAWMIGDALVERAGWKRAA